MSNYSNGKTPKQKDAVFYRSSSTGLLHACTVLRVEKDGQLILREAGAKEPLPTLIAAADCILQADHNASVPAATASPLATLEKDPAGQTPAEAAAANGEGEQTETLIPPTS